MNPIAGHVLHLNLNTVDVAAAHRFYTEVFGLELRMQSEGDDGDWTFHGIAEPVSSAGWFLYDARGPRTSPGLEMVEWRRPRTLGAAYPTLVHRGMSSVRLDVPDVDDIARRAGEHGGTVVGELGTAALLLRDSDGIHVEVQAAPELPRPRLAGARIGCADLDAALGWYDALGFRPVADPAERALDLAGTATSFRSARLSLPDPAVRFELTQWLDPVAHEPAERRLWHRGMVRMALSVEDLDTAIQDLHNAGIDCPQPQFFAMPGTSIGGLRVLFLTDPDGFTVELVHRPARHFSGTPTRPGSSPG